MRAVPGMQGRAAEARVAGGARRRHRDPRVHRAVSVRRALQWLDEVTLTETERHIARLIVREIVERLAFLENVGIGYLSMDRARGDAVGRRGAAHPPGHADRLGAGRRALRARRAVDRPAPARQLEAHRDARAPARPRQHRPRRRARRADDARGRPPRRHRRRAPASTAGGSSPRARPREIEAVQGVADRPVPLGRRATIEVPAKRRKPSTATSRSAAPSSTTSRPSTSRCRSAR